MKIAGSCLVILLALGVAQVRAGELVVIVNSGAEGISRDQIADLYLGRSSGLTPIDQPANSPIYAEFYKKATGRDVAPEDRDVLARGRRLDEEKFDHDAVIQEGSLVWEALRGDLGYVPARRHEGIDMGEVGRWIQEVHVPVRSGWSQPE